MEKNTAEKSPQSTQIALHDGLADARCEYFANVPGAASQDLFDLFGGKQISTNERVAFENCYGASLAGKRSVLLMKGVGLNVCLDPYLHAVLNGVHAGMVVMLYEDIEATCSPERQDSRPLRDIFECIWLEPNTTEMAYEMAAYAPRLSELADMPIVIRITNQLLRMKGAYTRKTEIKPCLQIVNRREHFLSYWENRTQIYQQKLQFASQQVLSKFSKPFKDKNPVGVIMAGCCREELAGSEYSDADVLEIVTYPFDNNAVLQFMSSHHQIVIFEQGHEYVTKKIAELLGRASRKIEVYKSKYPDLSSSWKEWNTTEKLFKALKQSNQSYVVGDEGQFTSETTNTIGSCLCMGASVGIATGMAECGAEYPFAVTGDVSFLFGGMQSLQDAVAKKVKLGIIVIDNGKAASTGGQARSGSILQIPNEATSRFIDYEAADEQDFFKILNQMKKDNQLAVLYVSKT